MKDSTKVYADLHAFRADDIKGSSHAFDKLDDFDEAFISNTPGAINEEDQVCLGTLAHCDASTTKLM